MPIRAYLYDAEGSDREITLTPQTTAQLGEKQLLWVDLSAFNQDEVRQVAEHLKLPRQVADNLLRPQRRPRLDTYGTLFQMNINAVQDEAEDVQHEELDFVIAPNLVLTAHQKPIDFLESFDRRVQGNTQLGELDAPAFVVALLDWHLTNYFRMIEKLEEEVDRLDEEALQPQEDSDLLSQMVTLRRQVSLLRRTLTPHREVYAALMRPDLAIVSGSAWANHFATLHERLIQAIEAAENARELLVGSFNIYAAQTAQRTNDIVRLLTVVSVVLLPIGAIAGLMGMNFKARIFDTEDKGFWGVMIGVSLLSLITIFIARRRRWF